MTMAPMSLKEIFDLTILLRVGLVGPDADTALDGMRRMVLEIRRRAEHLKAAPAGI